MFVARSKMSGLVFSGGAKRDSSLWWYLNDLDVFFFGQNLEE